MDVQKQLEFWFSDANLNRDAFLRDAMGSRADGLVAVATLAGFKKMMALGTPDRLPALIVTAAKSSPLLRVSADELAVGRVTPFVLKSIADLHDRTVYCDGYPTSWDQSRLWGLLASAAPVAYVSMPRNRASKAVKGYALVEFESVDGARAAVARFAAAGAQPEDPPLRATMKADWDAETQALSRRLEAAKTVTPLSVHLSGVCVRVEGMGERVLHRTLKEALLVAGCPAYIDYPGGARAQALLDAHDTSSADVSAVASLPPTVAVVRYRTPIHAAFAVAYFSRQEVRIGGSRIVLSTIPHSDEVRYLEQSTSKRTAPACVQLPVSSASASAACAAGPSGDPCGSDPVNEAGEHALKRLRVREADAERTAESCAIETAAAAKPTPGSKKRGRTRG